MGGHTKNIYEKKSCRGSWREIHLYQTELTKISAGTKPQRFRYWY